MSSRASAAGLVPSRRHHDGLAAAPHRGVRFGGHQADHLGVLHGPAEPREHASVTDDTCGSTATRSAPYSRISEAADPVQQRVAAGDHVHVALDVVEQRAQRGQHRRRPLPAAPRATVSSSRSSWRRDP